MIKLLAILAAALAACAEPPANNSAAEAIIDIAATAAKDETVVDSLAHRLSPRLTEADFRQAASELGVNPATIHAVVEIEAGKQHQGFWAEGKPLINFDLAMFRSMARRNGVNLSRYAKSHPVVFAAPNRRRYGGYQAAQQARLDAAMTIHPLSAIQGTFWGMFQIGGFNWKKCGCASAEEFARRMGESEHEQLELFVQFLRATGLDKHLQSRNWAAFARGYNGPGYARRGYHTRLAQAYARYKKQCAAPAS